MAPEVKTLQRHGQNPLTLWFSPDFKWVAFALMGYSEGSVNKLQKGELWCDQELALAEGSAIHRERKSRQPTSRLAHVVRRTSGTECLHRTTTDSGQACLLKARRSKSKWELGNKIGRKPGRSQGKLQGRRALGNVPLSQSPTWAASRSLWSVLHPHHVLTQGLGTHQLPFLTLGVSSGKGRREGTTSSGSVGAHRLTQDKWPPQTQPWKAFIKQLSFSPAHCSLLPIPHSPTSLSPGSSFFCFSLHKIRQTSQRYSPKIAQQDIVRWDTSSHITDKCANSIGRNGSHVQAVSKMSPLKLLRIPEEQQAK